MEIGFGSVFDTLTNRSAKHEIKKGIFEFEGDELERGGLGKRLDGPCCDVDSDAHTVGRTVTLGVTVGAHELFTLKEFAMPSRLPWTRESCREA